MSSSTSFLSPAADSSSPYTTPITEILQLLEDASIVTADNKQQAIAIAQDYLQDHSDFISIIWTVDDVFSVADSRKLTLTQEQCLDVLEYLDNNHDANYGISWASLECALDSLNFN